MFSRTLHLVIDPMAKKLSAPKAPSAAPVLATSP
jgi:hypothetical protein